MVNNSTNINQANNNLFSPQTIEHKKDHEIWHGKLRSWLRTGTKYGRIKPVLKWDHINKYIIYIATENICSLILHSSKLKVSSVL